MKKVQTAPLICCMLLALQTKSVYAQNDSSVVSTKPRVFLEYNFIDLPFQIYAGKTVNCTIANPDAPVSFFKGMSYRSMEQSSQVYRGLLTSVNWGVTKIPLFEKHPVVKNIFNTAVGGTVSILMNFAGGKTWVHEEWHRSMMVLNYTSSYNPASLFDKREEAYQGAVSYILDTNLVMIKDKNAPDFIRLSEAGIESEVYTNQKLQNQNFVYHQKLAFPVIYLTNFYLAQNYIYQCANKKRVTEETDWLMKGEGNRQELRDFIGLDMAAWAYDLWKPNEPYAARGLHPNGNGYDRYITGSDLTDEQYKWLSKQARLALLNLLSPMNFFISSINIKKLDDGSFMRGNASFRYYPTSFGNQIGLDLLLSYKKINIIASPHLNQNFKHSYPGVDFSIIDYPLVVKNGQIISSTIDLTADMQPTSYDFLRNKSKFVGSVNSTFKWNVNARFYPTLSLFAKTAGWIKGDPFLKSNFGFNVGLGVNLQKEIK